MTDTLRQGTYSDDQFYTIELYDSVDNFLNQEYRYGSSILNIAAKVIAKEAFETDEDDDLYFSSEDTEIVDSWVKFDSSVSKNEDTIAVIQKFVDLLRSYDKLNSKATNVSYEITFEVVMDTSTKMNITTDVSGYDEFVGFIDDVQSQVYMNS